MSIWNTASLRVLKNTGEGLIFSLSSEVAVVNLTVVPQPGTGGKFTWSVSVVAGSGSDV